MMGDRIHQLIIQGWAEGMEGTRERNCINATTDTLFTSLPFTHTHTHTSKVHCLSLSPALSLAVLFFLDVSHSYYISCLIWVSAGDNLAMLLSPAMRSEVGPGTERGEKDLFTLITPSVLHYLVTFVFFFITLNISVPTSASSSCHLGLAVTCLQGRACSLSASRHTITHFSHRLLSFSSLPSIAHLCVWRF